MRGSLIATALAATVATLPTAAYARSDQQLWVVTALNVKLSDKWRLQEEVTTRFSDNRNGLYEVESNTLLGYRLNKTITLWGGYTHDPQYSAGHFTTMEHRLREQVTFDNVAQLGPGKLSFRIRGEQRWRRNVDGTAWRLRPYVKYSVPLGKRSKAALVLSSEPFFNLNTTRFQGRTGLDRVRNLIAINTPVTTKVTAEFGYMNQHIFVRHGEDESDNIAWLSFGLNL